MEAAAGEGGGENQGKQRAQQRHGDLLSDDID
jgi:hypothetical protein